MKHVWIYFLLIVEVLSVNAQSPKFRVLSVPVQKNGEEMREPWAGGMNAPQFSAADINVDGIKDLFVFDRSGNRVMVYLGNGGDVDTAFNYSPRYESLFPDGMSDFALLRDYNNDSIPDIFTHTALGTLVLKGSMNNGMLHFDTVCPLVKYQSGPFSINIWTASTDIPLFADVNGDGDMDVLSYGVFGTTIGYYENQHMEHPGDIRFAADSFRYEEVTQCWGNAAQNSLNNSMELNISCKGNLASPGDGSQRHAGNSLFGFDSDADGDVDLLNGNIGYSNLAFLKNCGTATAANICVWDSAYPSCGTPIHLPTYPAAFGMDLNRDGKEDLLLAPNIAMGGNDVRNVQYYRNNGNVSCPFELVSDTFLVSHLLDFGTDSKPVFHDVNGDGLQDILVGNYSYFKEGEAFRSSLAYLENIGTPTFARFQLVTADFDSLSKFNLVAMHPSFGDMDGDGRADMIAGESGGWLHYFRNTSFTGTSFPAMTQPQYFNLKVGQSSTPFIYDVNGDSLNDLLVGNSNGTIYYYWNYGTKNNPQFNPDSVNQFFGEVNVIPYGFSQGFSAPVVVKNSLGEDILLAGSAGGTVYSYRIDASKWRNGKFELLDSNYLQHRVGMKAVLSASDLNQDGHREYVLGNSQGGLMMFSDSLWDSTVLPFNSIESHVVPSPMKIYPNPARSEFMCELGKMVEDELQPEVYSVLGNKMQFEYSKEGTRIHFRLSDPEPGLYFIRIRNGINFLTGKVMVY